MRNALIAVSLLLFVSSTLLTLNQRPWAKPFEPPSGSEWFLYPRNPPAELPLIGAHLRTVWALPDNKHVWAGGDLGMLVASVDEGESWTRLIIPPAPLVPAAAVNASPAPLSAKASGNPRVDNAPPLAATAAGPVMAFIAPQTAVVGSRFRATITFKNFKLIPGAPAIAGDANALTLGMIEVVDDYTVIVPVTVTNSAVPGQYTIGLRGLRTNINLPVGVPYTVRAVLTVEAGTKSAPVQQMSPNPAAQRPPDAAKGAMLFWHLPVVYAAEGQTAGPDIATVRFQDEKSGGLIYESGQVLSTNTGGAQWSFVPATPTPLAHPFSRCLFSDLDYSSSPADLLQCTDSDAFELSSAQGEISGHSGRLKLPPADGAQFSAMFLLSLQRAWLITVKGRLFDTADGEHWNSGQKFKPRVNGLFFQPDGKRGWAVGDSGAIFRTYDGGSTWTATTKTVAAYSPPYTAGPAPWYLTSLLFSALLLGIALLPSRPAEIAPAIEIIAASDRPLENEDDPDPLSFRPIARGLAYFIRNRRTTPPLNFAITGPWGSGKTSLMQLLRSELKKHGFRPVWFNAWHHQKEDYLLPSLLETIRQEAVPKLWQRGGIGFRLRLLRSRWQWWFAILALTFAGAFAFSAVQAMPRSGAAAGPLDFPGLFKQFGPHWAVALASGLALLATLRKWLSAFGVEPAALLAASSAGARVADLEKQTSFRYRFAREFRQVTKALGARQMAIFIDDLDRCQPQNTLDVLEAVNFLSSSGECFVVMGMAKELVEEYVARSLDQVAAALNASRTGQPAQTAETLAAEYLQKLINIEVPVPPADAAQMSALVKSLRQAKENAEGARAGAVLKCAHAAALTIVPALIAVFLGLSGWGAGQSLMKSITAGERQKPEAPTEAARNIPATASPSPEVKADPVVTPAATAAPAKTDEPPESGVFAVPQTRSEWRNGWPILLIVPLMIWAVYRAAAWRPDLEPDDSDEFAKAMEMVLPIVMARARTPRAVKRFVNKVRYIAMRRRQFVSDDRTWWMRLTGKKTSGEAPAGPLIQDGAVVILAALEYWQNGALASDEDMGRAFSRWPSLAEYPLSSLREGRPAYLRMTAGLSVN